MMGIILVEVSSKFLILRKETEILSLDVKVHTFILGVSFIGPTLLLWSFLGLYLF